MATEIAELTITKRQLILRDSLAFLTLILITLVLFGVTLLLFRSFEEHRSELAQRWAARGQNAFNSHHPEQAIGALRTALTYAPDQIAYQMLLAESLAQAGRTEEAYNYFLGLWDARPGDGFLNLQLARLTATRKDVEGAVHFYRSSIYGTWEGDGVERRREVRLELARYLIEQHQFDAARTELLIADGNAPEIPSLNMTLAQMLEQAQAPADALKLYRKVIAQEPNNAAALGEAGRLAFEQHQFASSRSLLERAARQTRDPQQTQQLNALLTQVERIQQLDLAETLPVRERVNRILAERGMAQKRLQDCITSTFSAAEPLQPLADRWTTAEKLTKPALLRNPDQQTAMVQLIYDTEIATSQHCGPPTGDDALLLALAQARSTALEVADHP